MNLEEDVRTAVQDLADEAPAPFDLATVARTRGRRLRRRRRAGYGALAFALVAVAVAPYAALHREATPMQPAPMQPATPAPTWSVAAGLWDRPYRLPGGAIVTAINVGDADEDHQGDVLLDRRTGRYVPLPAAGHSIWAAPVGGRAVIDDGRGGIGIIDAAGDHNISQNIAISPVWSSDGTRILFTTSGGYGVMEAATGDIRWRTTPMDDCSAACTFTWLPDDRQVAIARRDPAEPNPDVVKDVAIYTADTARLVRTVPVPGDPMRQDAWSADGRLVLVHDRDLGEPAHIVEVATGRTVGRVPGDAVHFLPDGRILSITEKAAELYDVTGRLLERQVLPIGLRDRELNIGRP